MLPRSLFSPTRRSALITVSALSLGTVAALGISNSITNAVGFSRQTRMSSTDFPKGRSEEEWRTQLSPAQFRILRKKGTEMAGTGEYDKHYPSKGVYECAACGTPLYTAETKFKSGCGWPAFYDAIPGAVTQHRDTTFGMERIELCCAACGGHLGHLFKGEGYDTPTDERACINSISLKFNADEDVNGAKAKA